jgi:hypothetical protein
MSEVIEPHAPPKANLVRPAARAPLPLTPDGLPRLGPLLQETLRVWRAEAATFTLVVLAVRLPLNGISAFLVGKGIEEDVASSWTLLGWSVDFGQHLLLELLLGSLSLLALSWLVERIRQDESRSFGESLRAAVSRWPAGLWTQLLGTLAWMAGLVLLLIPGLFIGVAIAFSPMLVALRGRSGLQALQGSWDLVRGRWWPVFWLWSALLLLEVGLTIPLWLPFEFLSEPSLLLILTKELLADFVTSFFFVAMVIVFLELDAQPQAGAAAPALPPLDEPEYIGTGRARPPAWIDIPPR